MRDQCIKSVESALGRPLRAGEAAEIEQRIVEAKKQLAIRDRKAYMQMPENERLVEAGKLVSESLQSEFAKKQQRLALDMLAAQRAKADIEANKQLSPLHVINRMLAVFNDGKSQVQSVDSQARSIATIAKSMMLDVIDATKGKWLGMANDVEMNRDIVRELHGTDTGNGVAAKAAKQFQEVAETLRERFNRAGGDVGKLEDWAMPHVHSAFKVAKAGRDAWVNDILPMINRDRYVNEDGSPMTDAQVREFLNESYISIATDGANKIEAGQFTGGGKRSNRGSESRVLHFKGGDDWLAYQAKYGEGDLLQIMMGHIDGLSRDIALVERFGSNPNHMLKMLLDDAEKSEKLAGGNLDKVTAMRKRTERLYDEVARNNVAVSTTLAEAFAAYRSINVASRLGGATLSSFTDAASIARTAWMHGLAYHRIFGQGLKNLNPLDASDRELARSIGLGVEEMLASMNRYNDDGLTTTATRAGKVAKFSNAAASAVMRASGLNAITAARKQAFSMMLMDKYGKLSRSKTWQDLEADDRSFLESTGITEQDWQIWQKATPLERSNGSMILSARDIMAIKDLPLSVREQAATRYMAHILDEQGMAVIEAGARERAKMYGYLQKGTWTGEIGRSMLQFKSFTAALMMRHGARMMGQEGVWGKAAYGVPLFVMMSLLGGLVTQLREIAQGNDPQDMTQESFYANAVLAGGALGVYGDILKAGSTPDGRGFADLLGGPIVGDIVQAGKISNQGIRSAMGDENSNAANETVKFAKSHIPFANLWYTRAATDRLIFNQLQEMANPGYLRRQEAKARRKYDRTSWWSPSDVVPDDAPDFGKAVGE
jgi:hypothetical protein